MSEGRDIKQQRKGGREKKEEEDNNDDKIQNGIDGGNARLVMAAIKWSWCPPVDLGVHVLYVEGDLHTFTATGESSILQCTMSKQWLLILQCNSQSHPHTACHTYCT